MHILFPSVTVETYELYTHYYKPIFDEKYHLDVPLAVHPFMQSQRNLVFAYNASGEYVGGSNILFLENHFYDGLIRGDIVDDMTLSLKDVKSDWTGDRLNVYISSIYVRESYRGQDIASHILKFIEAFAAAQVAREVNLLAVCITDQSVNLFRKQGYDYKGRNAVGDHLLSHVLRG